MSYFCLVNTNYNTIAYGPFEWNRRRFESELRDEYEINITLSETNPNFEPVTVNSELRILHVNETKMPPDMNGLIHTLAGPFLEVNNYACNLIYNKVDKPIDEVKAELKSKLADSRWKYETSGINVSIRGIELFVTTQRGERDIFLQSLQLGADGQNWKFGNTWIQLSLTELGSIVQSIVTHVQEAFDWESSKITELDSVTVLEDLISFETRHPSQIN